jgi:hypothetical protein
MLEVLLGAACTGLGYCIIGIISVMGCCGDTRLLRLRICCCMRVMNTRLNCCRISDRIISDVMNACFMFRYRNVGKGFTKSMPNALCVEKQGLTTPLACLTPHKNCQIHLTPHKNCQVYLAHLTDPKSWLKTRGAVSCESPTIEKCQKRCSFAKGCVDANTFNQTQDNNGHHSRQDRAGSEAHGCGLVD